MMNTIRVAALTGAAAISFVPSMAAGQDTDVAAMPAAPEPSSAEDGNVIIVTARQREETLQDVPVAVTAISGDTIKEQQIILVKDIAARAPGLNINSDSAGRAFVTLRGIGTTFIDTVQPGVGIFVDGIYQPNTSYLNSPLVDVERVEVLRGPQGTLFGNNTLGGAINVITRKPTNEWEGRLDGSLASGDNFASASASVSGPIVDDLLKVRVGAAYHTQDGFEYNTLLNDDQNPLETKSVNGTLLFTPGNVARFTINASWDQVFGGSVPYFTSQGPTDFELDGQTNQLSLVTIDYYALNGKAEIDIDAISSTMTAIGSYNQSDARSFADGDFTAIDFLRATNNRFLKTTIGELRLDTRWSDSFSTLVGLFHSHATNRQETTSTLVPLGLTVPASGFTSNDNYAVFGTVFWDLDPTLQLSAGVRFDHQKLEAETSTTLAGYKNDEIQPRVSLTKKWTPDFMTYVSVARGARGGGQNEPNAPNVIYEGDSVWTYEAGAKGALLNGDLNFATAIFYNDYKNFIGPNALAPSTAGPGFVAINLNAGDVESYGVEFETDYRLSDIFSLYGNLTLMRARVTDGAPFQETTGYAYPGDRLGFVPDITYLVGAKGRVPFLVDQAMTFDAHVVGKGERVGATLDAASIPIMPSYNLVNASLGWETGPFTVAVFATNLFNEKYQETYLDSSLLGRAGVPPFLVNNLALQGNRRRVGLRGTIRF